MGARTRADRRNRDARGYKYTTVSQRSGAIRRLVKQQSRAGDNYTIVSYSPAPVHPKNQAAPRGLVQNTGTGDDALAYYKEHFKIYPLASGPRADGKEFPHGFRTTTDYGQQRGSPSGAHPPCKLV